MTYKITDEFLDCVDRLLDSVMEMSQHAGPMTASGVTLVELKRFELVRDNAVRVCDAMEDGFPEYGKDEEDEETTKECANSGDDDPAAVFGSPDGFGGEGDGG